MAVKKHASAEKIDPSSLDEIFYLRRGAPLRTSLVVSNAICDKTKP